jgi:hypothetical protein
MSGMTLRRREIGKHVSNPKFSSAISKRPVLRTDFNTVSVSKGNNDAAATELVHVVKQVHVPVLACAKPRYLSKGM